jgi:hypothetical protein
MPRAAPTKASSGPEILCLPNKFLYVCASRIRALTALVSRRKVKRGSVRKEIARLYWEPACRDRYIELFYVGDAQVRPALA